MVKNRLLVNCVNISLIVSLLTVSPTVHRASWVSSLVLPQAQAEGLGSLTDDGTTGLDNQEQWSANSGGRRGSGGGGSGAGGMLQQILQLLQIMKFMDNNKLKKDQKKRADAAGSNLIEGTT